MTRLVIIGCGGFGREVHDVVDAIVRQGGNLELLGFVDDNPSVDNRILVEERRSRILGPLSWLDSMSGDTSYVIGIGNPQVSARIDRDMSRRRLTALTLVHPDATLGWNVRLSPGAIICAGARLSTNIQVGRHVHVDRNCLIGHDSQIGDYTVMFPGAAVAGTVQVGPRNLLGTHSTIIHQITTGSDATLAAGAVLVKNMPSHTVAKGVPARWDSRQGQP